MEGVPEGTGQRGRRLPRLRVLLLIAVAAAYLVFRLVQGVLWLAGHL